MCRICLECKREFKKEDRVASISGSIMGDEYTDSFFFCPQCLVYTVVTWYDNFTGVETVSASGPVPRAEGDERVALIGRCPRPWDKKCRCEAHRTYFRGALD